MSVTSRVQTAATSGELPRVKGLERALWVATIALYGIGDMLTSVISMEIGGTEATGFLASWVSQFGYIALLGHKLLIFGFIVATVLLIKAIGDRVGVESSLFSSVILVMFASRGVALVAWNSYIIYLLATGSGYALSPF